MAADVKAGLSVSDTSGLSVDNILLDKGLKPEERAVKVVEALELNEEERGARLCRSIVRSSVVILDSMSDILDEEKMKGLGEEYVASLSFFSSCGAVGGGCNLGVSFRDLYRWQQDASDTSYPSSGNMRAVFEGGLRAGL
ncbi:hypothetical protein JW710_04830 [Candidatus Dojkabacteria bacterium]|nr:hypothetical protein [Candidatus Dojkabacteria bacterium]